MKIIIVGAGKTGATVAKSLTDEGHEVTIVDSNAEKVQTICNNVDVMGFAGDGMNYAALVEAGLKEADILIAATGSDELNLLCCLFAKKNSNCATIARLRNPLYYTEANFIKEQIGISLIINPELTAATEISRLLRFPSAIDIISFSKGKVELLTFKIGADSVLNRKNLNYVRNKIESEVLFCCVERQGSYHIPTGNFTLQAGDKASIIIAPKKARGFFKKIGIDTHGVHDVMIVGGSTIAYYLAKQLLDYGIAVKIIENDATRCDKLAELLPGALIIKADGSDKNVLLEEGLGKTGGFVALTGFDEENVILSLFAKETVNTKVITKVDRISFNSLISKLNLDSIICPCDISSEYILQYVRTQQNAMGNNIESLYKMMEDQIEALEFKIGDNCPLVDKPLQETNLKDDVIICGIIHKGKFILPNGDSVVQSGDHIIVVSAQKKLSDVADILR